MHDAASAQDIGAQRRRVAGQCAVCRAWSRQAVCSDCVAQFAPAAARCTRCGVRTGSVGTVCGACLAEPPPYDACRVACDYAFPWDRLIGDFKFRAHVELAAPLARMLLRAVQRGAAEPPDCVLPIPLAAGRLAERGYNQAWELARRVAHGLRRPAHAQLLLRPMEGAHQAELTLAQRSLNLRGAFLVAPARRSWVQGRRVALVDDVMTSGATLRAAAQSLQRAGASHVEAWVLARTPAPADRD